MANLISQRLERAAETLPQSPADQYQQQHQNQRPHSLMLEDTHHAGKHLLSWHGNQHPTMIIADACQRQANDIPVTVFPRQQLHLRRIQLQIGQFSQHGHLQLIDHRQPGLCALVPDDQFIQIRVSNNPSATDNRHLGTRRQVHILDLNREIIDRCVQPQHRARQVAAQRHRQAYLTGGKKQIGLGQHYSFRGLRELVPGTSPWIVLVLRHRSTPNLVQRGIVEQPAPEHLLGITFHRLHQKMGALR